MELNANSAKTSHAESELGLGGNGVTIAAGGGKLPASLLPSGPSVAAVKAALAAASSSVPKPPEVPLALESPAAPTIFVASEVRPPLPPPKPPDSIPPHPTLGSTPFNQPAKSYRPMRRCPAAALLFELNQIRFWSNPRTSPSKFFNLAVCPLNFQVVNLAPQLSIRSKVLWIRFYEFLGNVLEIGDGMIRGRHKARRWFWAPGWHEGQVLSRGFFMMKIWDPGECLVQLFL